MTSTSPSSLLLALLLVAVLVPAAPASASQPATPAANTELLVTYDRAERLAGPFPAPGPRWAVGAVSRRRIAGRVGLVDVEPARAGLVAAALRRAPGVVAVEPNRTRSFAAVPDDTSYGLQWAHQRTNAEAGWDRFTGGGRAGEGRPLIAVLDSGADATHPDLADVIVTSLRSANGSVTPGPANNDECEIGHGTLVSGVAGARGDNDFGVAGLAWLPRIIDISLTNPLNECPRGPADADVIAALDYLAGLEEPPLVANLSFGDNISQCPAAYQAALDQAHAAGIALVAAASNQGSNATSVPASCDRVMSVAATTRADARATYSQFNPHIDLAAPGGQPLDCPSTLAELAADAVLTTSLVDERRYQLSAACRPTLSDPNGHRLEATQGTSFATPYVAALIAMVRQRAIDLGLPALGPDHAEAIVEQTARDIGPAGRDDAFGWGIVDVDAALELVEAGARPEPDPDPPFPVAGDPVSLTRVADPTSLDVTDPIALGVAASSLLPPGSAPQAVLARADDFADALAGAAVAFGTGPVLFTGHMGPLDPDVADELGRVLDFSSGEAPVVHVMGGTAAVPAGVDQQLRDLGVEPRRIAGTGREDTAARAAAVVAEQVRGLPDEDARPTRDAVFIASGRDFADAVAAGQMAAYYGIPVLVTNPEGLHPHTAAAVEAADPTHVLVVGGAAAISPQTYAEIEALADQLQVDDVERLAGETRIGTALAVFHRFTDELAADDNGTLEEAATVAVNLRAHFSDALAASLLGGMGDVYLPLDGANGTLLTPAARQAFCGFAGELFVMGGTDRIGDATVDDVLDVLAGTAC